MYVCMYVCIYIYLYIYMYTRAHKLLEMPVQPRVHFPTHVQQILARNIPATVQTCHGHGLGHGHGHGLGHDNSMIVKHFVVLI